MLPCLALAPELKLCILPSLRTAFSPHVGPNYAYSRHFCIYKPLYVQCASVHPGTTDVAEGTAAFHQDQLNKAVRYDDLDACIYLLRHYGAQGGLELSVPQLRKLASTSFNRHRPDAVLDVVRNIPKRHPKHYSVLMKECVKRRDLSALEKVIAAREAAGHAPDAYTATARLTALGAAGRASDVLTVLHEAWKVPSCRTIEVCNAAMGACASAGDCAMAEAVLSFLIDAGLAPDVVTYNSLIKAAGAAGMMAKVRGFYDDLRASGLVPTPLTYTSVFNAAAKNRHSDAVWLFQVSRGLQYAGHSTSIPSHCTCL